MKTIYLAGPEVFLSDAREMGLRKKSLCCEFGFCGLYPLDGDLPPAHSARETGLAISLANEALIREADMVIANLTPFRGPSADVGTVYELGLARGLGKQLAAYSNVATPYLQRVWDLSVGVGSPAPAGDVRDADGLKIEEFDLHDNLMLEGGIAQAGGLFLVAEGVVADPWRDLTLFRQLLERLASVG